MDRAIQTLPRLLTQQDCIGSVKALATRLGKKTNLTLQQVWLFGSYAQNKQEDFSDIDVAIVADEFESIGFIDTQLIADALIHFPLVEAHTYNTDDFVQQLHPFAIHIQKTGIRIL